MVPIDRYEIPDPMSQLLTCRTPVEVFPHGTLAGRRCDNDHLTPYRPGGPPGQTRPANLAKLSRFHHRLKTNGGWTLRRGSPGEYWWRTPHGHWLRVDASGTEHHGRDPDLDDRLIHHYDPDLERTG